MKSWRTWSVVSMIIALIIAGCSSVSAAPVQTKVVIDGKGEDWATYMPIVSDFKDDEAPGSPDIGEVRAFCNDTYLYVNIKLNKDGATDHYDLLLNLGSDFNFDYQLSIRPEMNEARFSTFPVTAEMNLIDGVTSAEGEVIEVKMPLSLVGGKPVTGLLVQTYSITNHSVDDMAQGSVPKVNEVETLNTETSTTTPGQ